MKLNVKAAFVNPTKDPLWKIKIGIGTILCLLSAMLSHYLQSPDHALSAQETAVKVCFSILSLIIGIFVSGYYYRFLHNIFTEKEEILPCWKDSKDILMTGITGFGALLVLFLPFILLNGFIAFLQALTKAVPHAFTALALIFLVLLAFIVSLIFLFAYVPFITLMSLVFARDLKFSSFFKFKDGTGLWKNHKFSFYILLFIFLIFFLVQGGIFMLTKYDIAVTTVLSLPNFYLTIVFYQLLAQWAERR